MITFPELLRRNAAEHGATAAIVTDDDSITHADLDTASRALAANLVDDGVGKGARVGILMPNGVDWAVLAAAAWRIGAVVVPLSTLLRAPELEAQLQTANVTHLVHADEFRGRNYIDDVEAVAPNVPSLRHVTRASIDHRRGGLSTPDALVDAMEAVVRPADDFVVVFTSGSRGVPKGTIHTHGSALAAVASGLDARRVGADDRLYIPMPFFWTGGLAAGLLTALVAGATLITEAIPQPDRTLALLERERVTLFRGWPDQAATLAAHPGFAAADLSSLRQGSLPAVLPPERRPAPGARPNLFGMTETFGPYCGARGDVDLPAEKWGSCGRPLDGIDVRILDPDANGLGEIALRGRNMMRAICGKTRNETFDADGFYATGDLGVLDADGYLWFHGRRDDMFKVNGATVYPSEVEAALRAIAGVQQAHVTNVTTDRRQAVGALVVSSRSLDDLRREVRARLSAFKVPTCWLLTDSGDEVPLTATAKVDKTALQELLTRKGTGQ